MIIVVENRVRNTVLLLLTIVSFLGCDDSLDAVEGDDVYQDEMVGEEAPDTGADTDSDTGRDTGSFRASRLYPGPCETIEDHTDARHFWYTYDDRGQLIQTLEDASDDGTIDATSTYQWNESGNLILRTYLEPNVRRHEREYLYDGEGNMTSALARHWESNGYNWTFEQKFDAAGERILERRDEGSDGHWESTMEWLFDDYGNIERIVRSGDAATGALSSERYYNEYESGRLVTVQRDIGDDGTVDNSHHYSYTPEGLLVREDYTDKGNSGTGLREYAYDENARLLSVEYTYQGDDGTVTESEAYEYHSTGALRQKTRNYSFVDNLYFQSINNSKTETYNEDGVMVMNEESSNGTGPHNSSSHSRTLEKYDDTGTILLKMWDSGQSYNPVRSIYLTTYHYDEFGNLLLEGNCPITLTNYYTADKDTCAGQYSSTTMHFYSCFQ